MMTMYPETISEVLVFKTNIREDSEVEKVAALLSKFRITRWNIDRSDVDNVLRIESDSLDVGAVISMVKNAGFYCEELPD
jgi:hypothetical protein